MEPSRATPEVKFHSLSELAEGNGHDKEKKPEVAVSPDYVRIVHRDDEASCVLFPKVVDRAMHFIKKYNAPTDPVWLSNFMFGIFQTRSDEGLMLAAVDADNALVGHLVANIQLIGRDAYAYVTQVEVDEGAVDIMHTGRGILETWGKTKGAKGLANMALSESTMRLWRTYYNFEIFGYLMLNRFGEDK